MNKSIKIGKVFPVLFFIHLIFSARAKLWKVGEDQFNSVYELCWVMVQNDSYKNLIKYNYRKFIKSYKVNNSHRDIIKSKGFIEMHSLC